MKHLLANGCSPIAVEIRTHRAAYQDIICSRATSDAIGIRNQTEVIANTRTLTTEAEIGQIPLNRDPFLCNHSFTRAASILSHTTSLPVVNIPENRPTSPFAGYWSGTALVTNRGIWPATETAKRLEALKWAEQLEQMLLGGAACSVGRVVVGGTTSGVPGSALAIPAGFDAVAFCKRFDGSTPPSPNNWTATTNNSGQQVTFSAAEWAFVRANVSWWKNYDIYSIDPEGNPNKPANKNMQYGWDAMFPSYNFGAYAASWGVTGLTTGTYQNVTAYGTGTGASFTPFNMGW